MAPFRIHAFGELQPVSGYPAGVPFKLPSTRACAPERRRVSGILKLRLNGTLGAKQLRRAGSLLSALRRGTR